MVQHSGINLNTSLNGIIGYISSKIDTTVLYQTTTPTMKPQPTFPIPAEITLQTVDSLPGIHEYLDLRNTSVTLRSTCDRVSLATLRRLLDRDLARVRSPHSQVGPGIWLRRLSLRLVEARFPSSVIPNHRVLCDWVTAEGDAQVVENLRAIE
jgi:hypothetical protein